MIFLILSIFWFIREIKLILFWVYLWQLKEYHIGRFIDHFRTEKGKQLFFNIIIFLKITSIIFLIFYWFFFSFLPQPLPDIYPPQVSFKQRFSDILFSLNVIIFFGIFTLYLFESIQFLINILRRKLKIPVLTIKTFVLISAAILLGILFIFFLNKISNEVYLCSFKILIIFPLLLLIFDILTPIIVSLVVLLFQPLVALMRYRTIQKAKQKREQFKDLLVIGVTGSYGKTSTKEFLATILSEKFKVLKTKEHQNSEIGISECILNDLKPEHHIFVVEMGAYNRGGIKLLCDIAKPKIGILTGINEQHMATFGSQENIIKAKYELIESLPEDGLAIFNGDNKYCFQLYQKTKINKKIASTILKYDIWAKDIKVEKYFLTFRAFLKNGENADFRINLLGKQNVEDILMTAIMAKELGMTLEEISKACQKIKPEQGGMKYLKGKQGHNIIDSTYSANPDGVIANLDYLTVWKGEKIIIMPCLIELGKASGGMHEKIGEKIGQVCNLAIITTKERFKDIKEGAIKSGILEENILFIENPKEIFEKIKNFNNREDIILLESRVPKELIDLLTRPVRNKNF